MEGKGRATICKIMREEGWAFRSRQNKPSPLSNDAIIRVTKQWIEYGGIVVGERAKDRKSYEVDPRLHRTRSGAGGLRCRISEASGAYSKGPVLQATRSGHKTESRTYPLAGLIYCAHCTRLAEKQQNPKLRTRLVGKAKSEYGRGSYRHRPGLKCGCTRTQNSAHLVEDEFVRLCQMLTFSPEAMERLKHSANALAGIDASDETDLEKKKTIAIARCRRKLEALRNLYEGGDMEYQEFLTKKRSIEADLMSWESYSTEASRLYVQLTLCVDALARLVELWDESSDEDRHSLARGLFDEIVFDLDLQQIVDFKLKPWAEQFLIVRGNSEMTGTDLPPAGIEPAPLPPEGNALSAELWGHQHNRNAPLILVGRCRRRKPHHWKISANLR